MTPNDPFLEAYQKLNIEQKRAVDTIEGPVMVIAGPGTGKTQILTLRIAQILRKTDTPPDAILALTYTESGATAMRKRLFEFVGPAAYQVNIYTFHGYASEIIARHPEAFERIIGSRPTDDIEQISLIRDAIATVGDSSLLPTGNAEFYVPFIRHSIEEFKKDAISPEAYRSYVREACEKEAEEKDVERQDRYCTRSTALAACYEEYERLMRSRNLFDFADMLVELVAALRADTDLKLELQESAQYILADEHQDANLAQNYILELLSDFHDRPNLFIVGDEKQAIFRFQGASLENFLYFTRKYQDAVVIPLTENYRSTQQVLDAAHELIDSAVGNVARPKLVSSQEQKGDLIHIVEAYTEEQETEYVGEEIARIQKENPHAEIAVLARKNSDLDSYARALSRREIHFTRANDADVFEDPMVLAIIALLEAIHNPQNNEALGQALFLEGFKVPFPDLLLLLEGSRREHTPIFKLMTSPEMLRRVGIEHVDAIDAAVRKIERLSRLARKDHALSILEAVVSEFNVIGDLFSGSEPLAALEAYRVLHAFTTLRVEQNPAILLKDVLRMLSDARTHRVRLQVPQTHGAYGVTLLTAHRSKGLEFDYVYIVRATEGNWSARKNRSFFYMPQEAMQGDSEDERRLMYVALTRARKRATLTWSVVANNGKENQLSQFALSIPQEMIVRESVAPVSVTHFTPATHTISKNCEFLKAKFLEKGLSPTALNHYLNDPWEFVFRDLISLPETQEPHQFYGTAIHEALRYYTEARKQSEAVSADDLEKWFVRAFARAPLPKRIKADLTEQGRETLRGYFEQYRGEEIKNVETEVRIRSHIRVAHEGIQYEIPLAGFIDKLERTEGGMRVTDYKTGKPKSRNHIEGKTAESQGDYKRQLVFYAMLLARNNEKTLEAVIDFVEPNERGKYKCESFSITNEEIADLEKTIEQSVKDILSFSFLDALPEKSAAYAALVPILRSLCR